MLFGQLAEIAGDSLTVDNPGDTNSLIAVLQSTYPALADMQYIIAVNKEVVSANTILKNGSVIAIMPPFSGG